MKARKVKIVSLAVLLLGYSNLFSQGNSNKTWTHSKSYKLDASGTAVTPVNESIIYVDNLGRTTQSLSFDPTANKTLSAQVLYDGMGRPVGGTMPAVSYSGSKMLYDNNLVGNFGYQNFSGVKKDNPDPIPSGSNLGQYYSSNSVEPAIAESNYPYTLVDYYPDPKGNVRRVSGVGEAYKMGSGHESKFYSMSSGGDLNYIFGVNRTNILRENEPNVFKSTLSEGFKTWKEISVDAEGLETITYLGQGGKVIAKCVSGIGDGCLNMQVNSVIDTRHFSYVDIHLPESKGESLVLENKTGNAGIFKIVDLDNYTELTNYTIDPTGKVTFTGAKKSRYLRIHFRFENPLDFGTVNVLHELDYSRWTLYYYDVYGRIAKIIPPEGLDCNGINAAVPNKEVLYNWNTLIPESVRQQVDEIALTPPTVDYNQFTGFFDIEIDEISNSGSSSGNGGNLNRSSQDIIDKSNFLSDIILSKRNVFRPIELADNYVIENAEKITRNGEEIRNIKLEKDGIDITTGVIKEKNGGNIKYTNLLGEQINGVTERKGRFYVEEVDIIDVEDPIILPNNPRKKGTVVGVYQNPNIFNDKVIVQGDVELKLSDANGTNTKTYIRTLKIELHVNSVTNGNTNHHWLRVNESTARVLVESDNLGFLPTKVEIQPIGNGFQMVNPTPNQLLNYYQYLSELISYLKGDLVWQGGGSPHHTMETRLVYDNLHRVVESTSPDKGTSKVIYNSKGLVKFVQDAQQKVDKQFSYIVYDEINRPIESGVYDASANGELFTFENFQNYQSLVVGKRTQVEAVLEGENSLTDSKKLEKSNVNYDRLETTEQVNASEFGSTFEQTYTKNRVVKTKNENAETWYSYNYDGTIDKVVKKIDDDDIAKPSTLVVKKKYKTIEYRYDVNHKLIGMTYEKGDLDEELAHYYEYDENNRIKDYYTSIKAGTMVHRGNYSYYTHGYLKRNEIYAENGDGLQGLDYLYTLEGQLKSINHPTLIADADISRDGDTKYGSKFLKDIFGMSIDYYEGDYQNSNYTQFKSVTNAKHQDRFDGLIKDIRWKTDGPNFDKVDGGTLINGSTEQAVNYFTYDKLGQLIESKFDAYGIFSTPLHSELFKVSKISYDKNGNILALTRNGEAKGLSSDYSMDNFTYTYGNKDANGKLVNNQLTKLEDNVSATIDAYYDDDLDVSASNGNFTYDASGRLKTYPVKDITDISYEGSGLVKEITFGNGDKVSFLYDDLGQRLKKMFTKGSNGKKKHTWYIRDIAGRVMAIYERDEEATTISTAMVEQPIYGAGKTGTYYPKTGVIAYEMRDHQGNVRATFKEVTISSSSSAFAPTLMYANPQVNVQTIQKATNEVGEHSIIKKNNVFSQMFGLIAGGIAYSQTKKALDKTISEDKQKKIVNEAIPAMVGVGAGALTQVLGKSLKDQQVDKVSVDANTFVGPVPINSKTGGTNGSTGIEVLTWTDYYPYGAEIESRKYVSSTMESYRNGYQGVYAEKDEETGWNAFELRMYDPMLAKWISPDPYNQYHSSYVGMGNSPINGVDPDGGIFGWGNKNKRIYNRTGMGSYKSNDVLRRERREERQNRRDERRENKSVGVTSGYTGEMPDVSDEVFDMMQKQIFDEEIMDPKRALDNYTSNAKTPYSLADGGLLEDEKYQQGADEVRGLNAERDKQQAISQNQNNNVIKLTSTTNAVIQSNGDQNTGGNVNPKTTYEISTPLPTKFHHGHANEFCWNGECKDQFTIESVQDNAYPGILKLFPIKKYVVGTQVANTDRVKVRIYNANTGEDEYSEKSIPEKAFTRIIPISSPGTYNVEFEAEGKGGHYEFKGRWTNPYLVKTTIKYEGKAPIVTYQYKNKKNASEFAREHRKNVKFIGTRHLLREKE